MNETASTGPQGVRQGQEKDEHGAHAIDHDQQAPAIEAVDHDAGDRAEQQRWHDLRQDQRRDR